MNKAVAVVTVNYNNYAVTREFINSWSNLKTENYKIFISDLSDRPESIIGDRKIEIISGKNKGYAHGVNLGVKRAIAQGFERFAVINNDTRISSDFLSTVNLALDGNSGSIIGGKIYYEKGFEFHKTNYQPEDLGKVIWYGGGISDWKNALTLHRGVDEVDNSQYDRFEKTDFITGCLMIFDKQVIDKIGFWDEGYFLYFEDADYCERAKKNGVNLFYDPKIIIWHKNAQSTDGSGSRLHQHYQKLNRLHFGLKYAPCRTKLHLLINYFFSQ